MYNEEEDVQHEGRWAYSLLHEEEITGELHSWWMSFVSTSSYHEVWDHELRLANLGWERYRQEVLAAR